MKLLPAIVLLLILPLAARAESPTTEPKPRLTLTSQIRPIIRTVVFSPDGKTLAVAGPERIELWDVATGKQLAALEPNTPWSPYIAFSPDSKTLASDSQDGGTIKLWDVATGKNTTTLKDTLSTGGPLVFSPDGKTLASVDPSWIIRIWDLATGKTKRIIHTLSDSISTLTFTPDGRTLIATGSRQGMTLWDVSTAKQVGLLAQPPDNRVNYPKVLGLSPDGKSLVSGGKCVPMLKLWDLASQKMTAEFTGDLDAWGAAAVFFALDGKSLTWLGIDRDLGWVVTVHDLPTGKKTARQQIPRGTRPAAFSPDGKTLVTTARQTLYLWTIAPTPVPTP